MIAALAAEIAAACGNGARMPLRFVKLGAQDYPDPRTALVFVVFEARGATPVAVAKVARSESGDAGIEAETQVTTKVRAALPPDLASGVAELLAAGRLNGRAFAAWRALPGQTDLHHINGARGGRRAEQRVRRALAWIERAADATAASPTTASSWLGPLERVVAELVAAGCDGGRANEVGERVAPVWRMPLAAGIAHNDFFPGNVLFAPGRIGVLDWGGAEARAPRFVDPLAYELSFALHALATRGGVSEAERRAVHELEPFRQSRRELATHGLDASWGSPIRMAAIAAGVVRERRAARSAACALWLRLLHEEIGSPAVRLNQAP
jgi:aminoglycoside phosphotransferase (APT) family kinase protein